MIKVGLVGEDPNDTSSIKNLLEKRYSKKVQFYQMVKGIKGYQLDSPKIRRSLPIEFESKNCSFVVYIRDLDGFQSEKLKVSVKINWFKELDAVVNKNGLLLLNIWELEALILADIGTFNKLYRSDFNFNGDPMLQKEPKEILMSITSKLNNRFKEAHCPEIFKHLDIDTIQKNADYFKSFIREFGKKIA